MPLKKTLAINLKSIKVGEADKIIRLFSRDLGKISCIAKGARKPKSKFGGRLEVFAYNEYLIATGKSLFILSQVETIEHFYKLRENPDKLIASTFLIRLTDASIDEGQKNTELFDLLLDTLRAIKNSDLINIIKLIFMIKLMKVEGFFPYTEGCVKCKRPVTKEPDSVTFNPYLGGITCTKCSTKTTWGTKIPFNIIKIINKAASIEYDRLQDIVISKSDEEKINLISRTYIGEHIGKDIINW